MDGLKLHMRNISIIKRGPNLCYISLPLGLSTLGVIAAYPNPDQSIDTCTRATHILVTLMSLKACRGTIFTDKWLSLLQGNRQCARLDMMTRKCQYICITNL